MNGTNLTQASLTGYGPRTGDTQPRAGGGAGSISKQYTPGLDPVHDHSPAQVEAAVGCGDPFLKLVPFNSKGKFRDRYPYSHFPVGRDALSRIPSHDSTGVLQRFQCVVNDVPPLRNAGGDFELG